ncbi:MAG: signal peptidase II [Candidatus Omnitrophica bacterium]|nr:signal peptidase II [Candidatus Omnitrophota bacterium]
MIFPIVIAILFLDQASKFLFTKFLNLNQSFPVVPGIFHFTLVHNRGAAFGILRGQVFLFILTSFVAVVLIYLNLKDKRRENSFLFNFSLALILAGGLGNLIDRIRVGYVIDFLDFRIWPVFNIADSAITIGAIILGWSICTQKSVK